MNSEKGLLYIVATPIGNLADMTFRGVDTLMQVDLIACEDTRVTKKLLQFYDIDTKVVTYHQHSRPEQLQRIIDQISDGKNIAIVTDAGTPGVSDPGNTLVSMAYESDIRIVPIPGPSALSAMISIAGIDMQRFLFLAYPPHKKGRQTFFENVCKSDVPVVYYESVHRLVKNLSLFSELCDKKELIVGKELTKIYETIVRGSIQEVLDHFEKNPDHVRGEFVVIAYNKNS
jgi:16S rRNA (cytidine1402-2'-O)-methyltransferase